MSTTTTKVGSYGDCRFCGGPGTGTVDFEGEAWAFCSGAACAAEVTRLAPVVKFAPTSKPPLPAPAKFTGFGAPSLTPAGTLRHSTTRLLGALKVLAQRMEEDIAERVPTTSAAERIRLRGINDSYVKVLERMAAVEADLRATA